MICPKCKIPLEKDSHHKVFEGQLMPFINWVCKKCGHKKFSLYDLKIKSQID